MTDTRKPGRGRIYASITETIGDTPIVRLDKFAKEKGVSATLLAKLEFFNPIASVKDRIGVAMIEALEADGRITPGSSTLVEPTSGNTGIALAFAAARQGLPPHSHHAGDHVGRAAQDAGAARCRTCADRRPEGHEGRDCQGRGAGRHHSRRDHPPAVREPGQSRNPTAGRPPKRSGTTQTGRSISSFPASAPAARSPAPARC